MKNYEEASTTSCSKIIKEEPLLIATTAIKITMVAAVVFHPLILTSKR